MASIAVSHGMTAALPITAALRRVVLGFRIVSAAWMTLLAIVGVVGSDLAVRAVPGPVVAVLAWTAITVAAFRQSKLSAPAFLVADVAVAVAMVLWHARVALPGESFLGGYPFSAVVLVAAMGGLIPGLAAAAVLAVVSVSSAATAGLGPQGTASTVLLYGFGAATVAWSARVISRHDERQRRIEQALATERLERVRSQERAETGALLHDSVLQVLALIQRRAADPDEVIRLARVQERSLRAWLEDDQRDAAGSVTKRLEAVAADVETMHAIDVDVVTAGETVTTPATAALVAATREALVNAARHGGTNQVSVFLQIDAAGARVFVRDRGRGFDPHNVAADRRGISESIRRRMERHGGRAELKTAPGAGTEWTLHVPLDGEPGSAPSTRGI